MPTSECRRGNCLSCVATVVSGGPFSLRVSDSTALCDMVKEAQLVPLCSAYVTGPNLSMDLDGGPSRAWELPGRWLKAACLVSAGLVAGYNGPEGSCAP